MLKGLLFFLKHGWAASKKYIIYLFAGHFISAVQPLGNIVLPKFIIDELLGQRRVDHLCYLVSALLLFNLISNLLSAFLTKESFVQRIVVSSVFIQKLSRKLWQADFGQIETPEYLDLKQKAEKFIYGDWHGFGYILDSSVVILSKTVTFAGIIAIIATMSVWVVLAFIGLVLLGTMVENWAEKKCVSLYMELASIERRGVYLSDLFGSFPFAKEIRLGRLGDWLMGKLRDHHDKMIRIYAKSGR